MKPLELLGTKKITSVKPARLVASITVQGSGGAWRFRLSLATETFNWLFDSVGGATAPRGLIQGTAEEGLLVSLTRSGGVAIVSGKSTVAISIAARYVESTESKVVGTPIECFCIELEGSDRYLITEPLADVFLSSSKKDKRKREPLRSRLFEKAWEAYHHVPPPPRGAPLTAPTAATVEPPKASEPPKVVEPPKAPEPVAAAPPPVVPEPVPETTHLAALPTTARAMGMIPQKSVADLKEFIDVLNTQVKELREQGADIDLRVDPDGLVRARLQVIIQQEL
jgi:hypothetical protein